MPAGFPVAMLPARTTKRRADSQAAAQPARAGERLPTVRRAPWCSRRGAGPSAVRRTPWCPRCGAAPQRSLGSPAWRARAPRHESCGGTGSAGSSGGAGSATGSTPDLVAARSRQRKEGRGLRQSKEAWRPR
uniref:Uncharacterized protein n=1 Tax=Arundo donax TaxID=35708 RepID=A0A0A9TLS5_ARUDO